MDFGKREMILIDSINEFLNTKTSINLSNTNQFLVQSHLFSVDNDLFQKYSKYDTISLSKPSMAMKVPSSSSFFQQMLINGIDLPISVTPPSLTITPSLSKGFNNVNLLY